MELDELFEFLVTGWGVLLTGFKAKDDPTVTDIEIPSEYSGAAVTELSFKAFSGSRYLRTVYVPDSVKRVMGCVFEGCTSLVSVRLPAEVYRMASYVFWNCTSLKETALPENLGNIPVGCFLGCSALERVEIPKGVHTIETWAFSGCSSLKGIVLPESVSHVKSGAFEQCTALESVIFGNPMATIMGSSSFEGCERLPMETLLMSALGTAGPNADLRDRIDGGYQIDYESLLGSGLFRFAMSLGKFERCDTAELVLKIIECDVLPSLELAAEYGWITAGTIDGFIDCASEMKRTEITAWLLDYKNRHFGFNNGDDYEL